MLARLVRTTISMVLLLYAGSVFAAGGTCPSGANYLSSTGQLVTLASLGITNCFYIAADGLDSNSGADEAHPWAHLPGMPTCTADCASALGAGGQGNTSNAGSGFIFKGGDTWNGSNFGITWKWGGTSANPIYIGVDKAWLTGSSWSRPIWTCGGATCSVGIGSYFKSFTRNAYTTIDNIEVTGLLAATGNEPNFFQLCGTYMTAENIYSHGWSTSETTHTPISQIFGVGCGEPNQGVTLRYNVVDGSDSSQNMMWFTLGRTPIAYGNIIRYVLTGIDGCGDDWHDNLVEYLVPGVTPSHQDGIYHVAQCYNSSSLVYNNVVRHITFAGSGGAVKLWLGGQAPCPFSSCTSYAFNNVVYDNLPGNMIDTGGHNAVNYGTWYIFNNTFDCGTDSVPGDCSIGDAGNVGGTMVLNIINNHWISTDKKSIKGRKSQVGKCDHFKCTETNGLYQSVGAAKKRGYTSKATHAFEPTSSNGSTVGKGTNQNSLCTAVNAIDSDAGAACERGTTYACTYDSTNHTVSCPTITAVTRPTGAWDVGAYQFITTTQASAP